MKKIKLVSVLAAAFAVLAAGVWSSCKHAVGHTPDIAYGVKLTLGDPTLTFYDVGEHFTSGGLTVYEEYSDNSSVLVRDGYSLTWNGSPLAEGSTAITAAKGSKKITVSYDGLEAAFYIDVEIKATSLAVTNDPDKTFYLAGEPLDTTGMVVTIGYDDGSYETVSDYEMLYNQKPIYNGDKSVTSLSGTRTITVDYANLSSSFTITVDDVVTMMITVSQAPYKTLYNTGDVFDTEGLIVTAMSSNYESSTIPAGDGTTGYVLKWGGVEISQGDTSVTATNGVKMIVVEYQSKTDSFNIMVGAEKVTDITVVTPPRKTQYGTTYDKIYDFTNLTVSATFEYGTSGTSTVMIPHQDTGAGISGYLLYETGATEIWTGSKVTFGKGAQNITVSYTYGTQEPVTRTFAIYVVDDTAQLDHIKIDHDPNKMEYITEQQFQSDGLLVYAYYSTDTTTGVKIDHKDAGVTYGYVMKYNNAEINDGNTTITQTEGNKTVTVSYTFNNVEKTDSFTIHVTQYTDPVTSLLIKNPDKTSYTLDKTKTPPVPEAFSTAGLGVTAVHSSGDEDVISPGDGLTGYRLVWNGETITNGNMDVTSALGPQTINVEYCGIISTFQINVVDYELTLTDLSVVKEPDKTEYDVGDAFTKAGLIVYAGYNDGSYKEIPYTGNWDTGYQLLWNKLNLTDGNTDITVESGLKNITVAYQTTDSTFTIVVGAKLTALTISTPPTRVFYGSGEPSISTAGLVVTGIYNDGENTYSRAIAVDSSNFCDASGNPITISTTAFGEQKIYVKYTDDAGETVISSDIPAIATLDFKTRAAVTVTGKAYFSVIVLTLDQRIADDYASQYAADTSNAPALHENPIVMYVSEILQPHSGSAYTGNSRLTGKTSQVGTTQNKDVVLTLSNTANAALTLSTGSTLTVYGSVKACTTDQTNGFVIAAGTATININGAGTIYAVDDTNNPSRDQLFTITQNITLNIADTKICGLLSQAVATKAGIVTIPSWAQYSSANSRTSVIYMTGGTLNLTKSASIAAGGAGAVQVYAAGIESAVVNISDNAIIQACVNTDPNQIDHDDKLGGGGVYLNGGTNAALNLSGSAQITNCNATFGGGVFVSLGGTVNIYDNAQIINCSAASNGGAYTGNGGGVCVYGSGTLNIDSRSAGNYAAILNNKADSYGGGVYMANSKQATTCYFTMSQNYRNSVRGNTASYGGGLYFTGITNTLTFNSGSDSTGGTWGDFYTFAGNTAANSGGGIYMNGGTLTLAGNCVVGNNTATSGSGGGVYINDGILNLQGNAVVRGNSALQSATASINPNVSTSGGGGIYINQGTVNITDAAQITGNTAFYCGGGINVGAGATVNITPNSSGTLAPSITQNTATYIPLTSPYTVFPFPGQVGGGGIFSYGNVNITSTTLSAAATVFIQNNTTTACSGGGIFIGGSGVLTLQGNVEVKGNSGIYGGGIMLDAAATVNMYYYTGPSGGSGGHMPESMPVKYGFPVLHGNSAAGTYTGSPMASPDGGGLFMGYYSTSASLNSCTLNIEAGRIQGSVDETDSNGTVWTHNTGGDGSTSDSSIYVGSLDNGTMKFSADADTSGKSSHIYGGGFVGSWGYMPGVGSVSTNVVLPGKINKDVGNTHIRPTQLWSGDSIRANLYNTNK